MIEETFEWAKRTDVGRVRSHNEDAVGIDGDIGLAVLADGMGGYNAGEVASAIAVQVITEDIQNRLNQSPANISSDELGYSRESIIVRDAVIHANQTIIQTAESQPQCRGMGTTVVVMLFYDNRMTVAHLGDSRLYRLRAGRLEQMTIDHSLVQELEEMGHYTHEEAQNSSQKNYVTRAMGVEQNPEVEIREAPVLPDDLYLLCSDGLSDRISDKEIAACLKKHDDNLDDAAEELIKLANEAGGEDNISTILTRVQKPFPKAGWPDWLDGIADRLQNQLVPVIAQQWEKLLRRFR